jgi:hypothetical protein
MADLILDLLNSAKLRARVVKTLADTCCLAKTIHDNPPGDMKDLEGGELWEEAWWRAQTSRDSDVAIAFAEKLFVKTPEPFRVTLAETLNAFWVVAKPLQCGLADEPIGYAEGVYTAFLNLVANQVLDAGDLPSLTVARVHDGGNYSFAECPQGIIGRELVPLQDDPNDPDGIVWMDKSFAVSRPANDAKQEAEDRLWRENLWDTGGMAISVLPADERGDRSPCVDLLGDFSGGLEFLEACVVGRISRLAGSKLTRELARILPSVIRSMGVVQESPNPASEDTFVIQCERRLPVITLALLVKNIQFIRRCLDAYFSRPSKKDSMERRIRNAASLLIESDTQTNDAVGLALSVAAIEALLGLTQA